MILNYLEMLKKVEQKLNKCGWQNMNLLKKNASNFKLDEKVDAILCTRSMVPIHSYEIIVEKLYRIFKSRKKIVCVRFFLISDFKGVFLNLIFRLKFKVIHQVVTHET